MHGEKSSDASHKLKHLLPANRVYNILSHKTESENIIYEDGDPETGFLILPDLCVTAHHFLFGS